MRRGRVKARSTSTGRGRPARAVDHVIRGAFVAGIGSLAVAAGMLLSILFRGAGPDTVPAPDRLPAIAERPLRNQQPATGPEITGSVPPARLRPTISPVPLSDQAGG